MPRPGADRGSWTVPAGDDPDNTDANTDEQVGHKDGGWDMKRILPDPVYDCAGGNIPSGARTICKP